MKLPKIPKKLTADQERQLLNSYKRQLIKIKKIKEQEKSYSEIIYPIDFFLNDIDNFVDEMD